MREREADKEKEYSLLHKPERKTLIYFGFNLQGRL
jgi:hypothetical protein